MDTDPAMLSVTYRPPEGRLRNGDVTGYVIRYTRVGSGVSQMMSVSDSNFGFRTSMLPELETFTSYSVEVAAVNVNGTGPFSDPITGISGQDGERKLSCTLGLLNYVFLLRTCYCSTFTNSRYYPVKISDIVMDAT